MSTKNPRVNVTFEENIMAIITDIAQRDHRSISSTVRELALEALEIREDLYLARMAEKLDKGESRTYSHEEAWK